MNGKVALSLGCCRIDVASAHADMISLGYILEKPGLLESSGVPRSD
jgi:hypothetical protein